MLTSHQLSDIEFLIREVGNFQIQNQSKVIYSDIKEKSLNQLVSFVDIESERKLVSGLKKITPNAGFLTEENTTTQKNEDLYWIIDPLDGTTNYLFSHTKYAISMALYQNKKPVYAHVFVPVGTLFSLASASSCVTIKTGASYDFLASLKRFIILVEYTSFRFSNTPVASTI